MSSIHDPRYKQLIDKLIRIRELKEVTQVELASRLRDRIDLILSLQVILGRDRRAKISNDVSNFR